MMLKFLVISLLIATCLAAMNAPLHIQTQEEMKNDGPQKYGGPVGFGKGKTHKTEDNRIPDETLHSTLKAAPTRHQ